MGAEQLRPALRHGCKISKETGGGRRQTGEVVLVVLGCGGSELLRSGLPQLLGRSKYIGARYPDENSTPRPGLKRPLGNLLPVDGSGIEINKQDIYGKGMVQPVRDVLLLWPENPPLLVGFV